MKQHGGGPGLWCLLATLAVPYGLAGYGVYLWRRDGFWPDWALGNFLPDAVVGRIFSLSQEPLRSACVWLLHLDLIIWLAVFPVLVWLIDRRL